MPRSMRDRSKYYKHWSKSEVQELRRLANQNVPIGVISLKLDRNERAIRRRAARELISLARSSIPKVGHCSPTRGNHMRNKPPSDARTTNPKAQTKLGVAPSSSPYSACKVRDLRECLALEEEELAAVTEIRSSVELQRHQSLFNEGDPAQHLFTVTDGVMRIYKFLPDGRRQITGFLYPGDFLGLLVDEAYTYSAEAVCHVVLCRYPRDKLTALLRRFPKMEHRLLTFACHELAAAQHQVMLLVRKTAQERIASFLIMISERAARLGHPDNPVSLPMTRADVADYLGLTPETVSRIVTRLGHEGVIATLEGGNIEITEREKLREIVEGKWPTGGINLPRTSDRRTFYSECQLIGKKRESDEASRSSRS